MKSRTRTNCKMIGSPESTSKSEERANHEAIHLVRQSPPPHYVTAENRCCNDGCLIAGDVDSVVVPADDACGGDGALAFARPKNNKVRYIVIVSR
ncbi:hypothetical protein BHE74_00017733 [Ensete ventricosum]|nr:hypothetical protein BHE74_00017733 [Ensete ventricosum]